MSSPLFTQVPSYSTQLSPKVRVLTAQFGDGYSQESADGINNISASWSLKFEYLTLAETAAVESFLAGLGGWQSFLWQQPQNRGFAAFRCKIWQSDLELCQATGMSATFEQQFDAVALEANALNTFFATFGGADSFSDFEDRFDILVNRTIPQMQQNNSVYAAYLAVAGRERLPSTEAKYDSVTNAAIPNTY